MQLTQFKISLLKLNIVDRRDYEMAIESPHSSIQPTAPQLTSTHPTQLNSTQQTPTATIQPNPIEPNRTEPIH